MTRPPVLLRAPLRPLLGLGSALLAAALLAGCSSAAGSSADYGSDSADGGYVSAEGGEALAPEAVGDMVSDDGLSIAEPEADREIIVTGWMTITVDDPGDAAERAARLAAQAGGRVDARSEQAPNEFEGGSANLTLRVPAAELDGVIDELRALGSVDELNLSSEDVTRASQDLDARIDALRDSIARLQKLVHSAKNLRDLITLEDEISTRQAELESLEAEQRWLADQVSMSTLDLWLRSEQDVPSPLPGDFGEGVVTGWAGFVAFWSGLLVVLGVLLPWLVTAALVTAVIVALVRLRRARRGTPPAPAAPSEAPLDTTPPSADASAAETGAEVTR